MPSGGAVWKDTKNMMADRKRTKLPCGLSVASLNACEVVMTGKLVVLAISMWPKITRIPLILLI